MAGFSVALQTVGDGPTALGSAGPYTLVADRPVDAGGGGLGFNVPNEATLRVTGDAPEQELLALVEEVDRVAEIPNSIRGTTPVTIVRRELISSAKPVEAQP
jgi:putative redox protein